jgi:N-methylhydantoinase B/oxoprolinase/acetone carboxylase alpha subunit
MGPIVLQQGEVFCHIGAGGGGCGDPLDRDPELCRLDLEAERYTADYIREVYGVVLDPQTRTVDAVGTDAARASLRNERAKRAAIDQPAYLRFFHEPLRVTGWALRGERTLDV